MLQHFLFCNDSFSLHFSYDKISVSVWKYCLYVIPLDNYLIFFQNGLNALHLASKEGHVPVVLELVKRGANVNAATKVINAFSLLC